MHTITRRLVAPGSGANFHHPATTTKEMNSMKRFTPVLAFLAVLVAVMGFSSNALANPVQPVAHASFIANRCGGAASNTAQLLGNWKRLGVMKAEEELAEKYQGFRSVDSTFETWVKNRVMRVKLTRSVTIPDYGCLGSKEIPVGPKTIAAGEFVFAVLPSNVGKKSVHATASKKFKKRRPNHSNMVAQDTCSNGNGEVVVYFNLYFQVSKKKAHPQPEPTPQPKTETLPALPASITINNTPVINVGQTQGQQQQQAQTVCLSIGGEWNETTQECNVKQQQAQCNVNQVLFGGVCVNKSCQEEGSCAKEKTCEEEGLVGTPGHCRERTCEEKHSCFCEKGLVGEYPNCRPKTCKEEGDCPKEKTCQEKNEVGNYPSCRPKTCQEEGDCQPPPPSPPTLVSVTKLNDVPVGWYSENFCATTEIPGNDTGTLIMAPDYGSFGPLGGTVTFAVKGIEKVCVTYYAPTEMPPGEMDTMAVTLRDNNTGLSATPDVQKFRIDPEPVNPS